MKSRVLAFIVSVRSNVGARSSIMKVVILIEKCDLLEDQGQNCGTPIFRLHGGQKRDFQPR